MKEVTVWAPSNIALVKYWGKRDEHLILPLTDSFSMTLSDIGTQTSFAVAENDHFSLNADDFQKGQDEFDRVFDLVAILRSVYNMSTPVSIVSKNNFPTAAGLASSASGIAALVFGLNAFFELGLSQSEMSKYARRGSGSASRSMWGGFVKWDKGVQEDGSDSIGKQVFDEHYWPELTMILSVVSDAKKPVSSRDGMRRTAEASALFKDRWVKENDLKVNEAIDAVRNKDFERLGVIVEENALLMHETMKDSKPSFSYLTEGSMELIERVQELRKEGLIGYVTMDAGPQVKILCMKKDVSRFQEEFKNNAFILKMFIVRPGSGPYVVL